MADCDICGVSRPTVCPVKVMVPHFKGAYPTGMWVGLCESCSETSHDANSAKVEMGGGKCNLCKGKYSKLNKVMIKVPSFVKGSVDVEKHICDSCLGATATMYEKKVAEGILGGHGHGHEEEHVEEEAVVENKEETTIGDGAPAEE